ncbi:MAG: hypothetical protein P9L94_10915 [Candidatus Hinthialibacter antarcticus]|nr:hypothetical protein [Candidatus Hinthialibacter antarcticus]
MKRLYVFSIYSLLVLACLFAQAQDASNQGALPRFELSTQPETVAAGQPFQFSVKVIYNSSISIKPQALPIDLAPFVIQDASKLEHLDYSADEPKPVDPATHSGLMYDEYTFTLAINEPGVQQIPSVPFAYQISNGQTETLATEPYPIGIEGAAADDELRDIKPPMELEGTSYAWVVVLVVIALLAALIAAYYLWRRKTEPELAPPPPVPAHVKALEALQAVRADEALFRERRLEELTIRVSEIVRVYLYDRYRILAMDYTTEEIIAALKSLQTPFDTHKAFRDFFEECDLIKFAKHELAGEAMQNLVEIAKQLVIKTQKETSAVADSADLTS